MIKENIEKIISSNIVFLKQFITFIKRKLIIEKQIIKKQIALYMVSSSSYSF